jgi:hypothetical protein
MEEYLLLEDGGHLLLEDGGSILLEESTITTLTACTVIPGSKQRNVNTASFQGG